MSDFEESIIVNRTVMTYGYVLQNDFSILFTEILSRNEYGFHSIYV